MATYYEKNRDKIIQRAKIWYQLNRDTVLNRLKKKRLAIKASGWPDQYYYRNKERILKKQKERYYRLKAERERRMLGN